MESSTIEGFPRAPSLRGKFVVIKFGGSSIDSAGLERFGNDIRLLVGLGISPVIVHGGGPEITDEMKRRNLPVKKVMGLRITDDSTLEVAKGVLSRINGEIVRSMQAKGISSMGMAGSECNTIICRKMPPVKIKDENGQEMLADLGWVGEVDHVDPKAILVLAKRSTVPVIYPICADMDGHFMNVNADTAAAHIAIALKAEELVLVTDVPGLMRVFGDPSSVIGNVRESEFEDLVKDGVVKEGMIPKLEACVMAIRSGVSAANMIDGKDPEALIGQLLIGRNHGTRITK
ncbi:MAG: acetylglutamate kinase [Methanomassiliicoccales archaeon]|nr:MAG: acetylglutamate kinase [Methanomassiliicoccales archaeon]